MFRATTLFSAFITIVNVFISNASAMRIALTVDVMENSLPDIVIADLRRQTELESRYESEVLQRLTFAFLTQNEQRTYFALDQRTGELKLAKTIDREVLCPNAEECNIALTVAVQPVQYFQVIGITVRVLDVNDNAPQFAKSQVALSLSESTALGFVFPLPQARDPDSPANGVVRYEIRTDSYNFALNVRNGSGSSRAKELELQLVRLLDFEEHTFFRIIVVAYDGGTPSRTGNMLVEITVIDENDNSPKFDQTVYEVSLVENRNYDKSIVTVKVTDRDFGRNGLVKYSFSTQTEEAYSNLFRINRDSGDIYLLRPLDYESQQSYLLQVVARDQGDIPAVSVGKVVIHVLDVNDNRPVITINPDSADGIITIDEELPAGTFVAHVSVTDADSLHSGLNCNFTSDGALTLQHMYDNEYKLVTSQVLDRENKTYHEATIRCDDGGAIPLSSTIRVTVLLADINDNAPLFSKAQYEVSVSENNQPNTFLTRLEAKDPDYGINGTVKYRLGNEWNYIFTLDQTTGVLAVVGIMDRELKSVYRFQVYAYDTALKGSLTSSTTVVVRIDDVDDNAPKFPPQHYHFSIDEGLAPGTKVAQLNATDIDLPPNNAFYYVITSMALSQSEKVTWPIPFDINKSTGIIRTTQTLDRERMASYDFRVAAQSNKTSYLVDSVHVTVTVHDINDNKPVFHFPTGNNNLVQLSSFAPVGYVVEDARIHASDMDIGKNSELIYTMTVREVGGKNGRNQIAASSSASSSDVFVIEQSTGLVMVNRELVLFKDKLFNLTVNVSDQGMLPLSTSAALLILVNSSIPFAKHSKDGKGYSLLHLPVRLSGFHLYILASLIALVLLVSIFSLVMVCRARRRRRRMRKRLADAKEIERERMTSGGNGGGLHCQEMTSDNMLQLLNDSRTKDGSLATVMQAKAENVYSDKSSKSNGRCVTSNATALNKNGKHVKVNGNGNGNGQKPRTPAGPVWERLDSSDYESLSSLIKQDTTTSAAQWRKVRFSEPSLDKDGGDEAVDDVNRITASPTATSAFNKSPTTTFVSSDDITPRHHQQYSEMNGKLSYIGEHKSEVPHYATVSKRNSSALPKMTSLVRTPSEKSVGIDSTTGRRSYSPLENGDVREGGRIQYQTTTCV